MRLEIEQIVIEKNTSIFLSLIELMDLVRKKKPKEILDLFNTKILPDGLSEKEASMVSVVLKLVMISFYQLDENFDRM